MPPAARAVPESVSAEPRFRTLSRRDLILLSAFAAMFPLVVLVNFYIFVGLTRLELGHWPVFNDPYPKALPSQIQHLSIALTFVVFPFVSVFALGLALWGRWRYMDFPLGKLLAVIITCAGLLLLMALLDPGGFLNWYAD